MSFGGDAFGGAPFGGAETTTSVITVSGSHITETTTVHSGVAVVGSVVVGTHITETTTVRSGTAQSGVIVAGNHISETTTVHSGSVSVNAVVAGSHITETTTVNHGAAVIGYVIAGSHVTETTTIHSGTVDESENATIVGSHITEVTTVRSGLAVLAYATTRRDLTSARLRGGIAYASWTPAVVETPDGLAAGYAEDKALAFGPVTLVGTQPTFTVTEKAERRQRDRVIVGGTDVTYFRGVETVVGSYQLIQPFGYGSASLTFPQVFPGLGDKLGEGDLSWFKDRAKVVIQRVDVESGEVVTDYRGKIEVHGATSDSATYEVRGMLTGPASWRWRPMPLTRATLDIGFLLAQATRQLGVRVTPRLGPETGIEVGRFGGMKFLEYIQALIGRGWTRSGNQWTMMPDDNGTFSIYQRDRDTIHGTCYLDKSSVDFDLTRDTSDEPNRIFGTSVTPAGMRYLNGAYPGMYDGDREFPGFMEEGDSGDGVLTLIQRLRVTHYLNAETAPGGYDEDVTEAVRRVQKKAGLNVTGNVNEATWNTIMSVDKQGASLKLARIEPLAQSDETRPYNLTPDGAIESRNDTYDPTLDKVDAYYDFGTGFKVQQTNRFADRQLEEGQFPNWTGTLRIQTGAIVAGEHTPGDPITEILRARDIRPGMNLWLPQFEGGTKVHVTAAVWNGGIAELQVDTRARDAWNAAQVIEGRREARKDPGGMFLRELTSSQVPKDAISEWSEVGGEIEKWDLVAGWNVRRVPAGQSGTVRSVRYETNPNAETVVAIFAKNVWPRALQRLVGNPLTEDGSAAWTDDNIRHQLERDHAFLWSWGNYLEPGGYSPGYLGEDGTGIFTGKLEDDAGVPFFTDNQDVLYVAVWADRDTTIPAHRLLKVNLEPA